MAQAVPSPWSYRKDERHGLPGRALRLVGIHVLNGSGLAAARMAAGTTRGATSARQQPGARSTTSMERTVLGQCRVGRKTTGAYTLRLLQR